MSLLTCHVLCINARKLWRVLSIRARIVSGESLINNVAGSIACKYVRRIYSLRCLSWFALRCLQCSRLDYMFYYNYIALVGYISVHSVRSIASLHIHDAAYTRSSLSLSIHRWAGAAHPRNRRACANSQYKLSRGASQKSGYLQSFMTICFWYFIVINARVIQGAMVLSVLYFKFCGCGLLFLFVNCAIQ